MDIGKVSGEGRTELCDLRRLFGASISRVNLTYAHMLRHGYGIYVSERVKGRLDRVVEAL